ncbi:MAG: LPXTG cell wall anchor domain-containing protein, partial [Clostridia bacterium]|nr:LPXTG cell wall anchor domain-containing protein [Clostridia bacterium]
ARENGSTLGAMTAVYEVEEPTPDQTEETSPKTGDMTTMAVAVATLALLGTAVIVSKKRNYN